MEFAGVLTAIAGGILRDVFACEILAVFFKELYASASIAGVLVIYVLYVVGVDLSLATITDIVAVISIRLAATMYGWNLPKAKPNTLPLHCTAFPALITRVLQNRRMSIEVAKIKGIPVRLHFTLLISFFLISWTLATHLMPQHFPNLTSLDYWVMGSFGAVLLFVSILLHELAHSVVATKYGIRVRRIILFIFGGVSDMDEEPKDFRKEFKMAIAGPATSFAIAGGLALIWWVVFQGHTGTTGGETLSIVLIAKAVTFYGAISNAILGAFNLIPAFPFDGGRVLRAGLVRWKGDYETATRIAAKVGIAMSYVFMGFGFALMLTGDFASGLWLILIGWFLHGGAQSYMSQFELSSTLSGVRLQDIMNTDMISLRPDNTVDDALEDYFAVHMKSELPVIDYNGYLLGMITLKHALNIPEYRRRQMKVEEVMTPLEELIIMRHDEHAIEALKQMAGRHMGKVFICDADGRLTGLVSKTDVINAARETRKRQETLGKISRSAAR